MKQVILFCTVLVLTFSCGSKETKDAFVPYADFVTSDLKALDSSALAVNLFTYDSTGKIIDTTLVEKTALKAVIEPFIKPSISDKKYFKHFKEDSYADEATNTFNFQYSTLEKDLDIRSVIVTTTLGENSKFASLILDRINKDKVTEKIFYEAGKQCVITSFDSRNNPGITKKYVWGY